MNLQVYTQEESRVALPSGKSLKSDKYVKIDMEIEKRFVATCETTSVGYGAEYHPRK